MKNTIESAREFLKSYIHDPLTPIMDDAERMVAYAAQFVNVQVTETESTPKIERVKTLISKFVGLNSDTFQLLAETINDIYMEHENDQIYPDVKLSDLWPVPEEYKQAWEDFIRSDEYAKVKDEMRPYSVLYQEYIDNILRTAFDYAWNYSHILP